MMNQVQTQVFNFLKKLAVDTIVNDDTSFECRFEDSKVIEFDFFKRDNQDWVCLTFEEVGNGCESQDTYPLSELSMTHLNNILQNVKSI